MMRPKNNLKKIGIYLLIVVLSILIEIWVLNLWEADLSIPFSYSKDALSQGAFIKGMIDNGWFWENKYIGAPSGFKLYDFPAPLTSSLHFLFLKIISFFILNYATVTNIYFLLSFPLIALTSFFVFRHLHLNVLVSITGSLLFAFLILLFGILDKTSKSCYSSLPIIERGIYQRCQFYSKDRNEFG